MGKYKRGITMIPNYKGGFWLRLNNMYASWAGQCGKGMPVLSFHSNPMHAQSWDKQRGEEAMNHYNLTIRPTTKRKKAA